MQPQAFDHLAASYDDDFTHSPIGRMQRQRVYKFLEGILAEMPDKKVLELNCGTGVDALWLAQQGCRVKATDLSSAMLEITRRKVSEQELENKVAVQQLSITQIDQLPKEEQYDLIFSNFGGLNCLSPESLKDIALPLVDRLRPGGHFVAVVMTDFCLWESLYFLARLSFRQVFRRSRRQALNVVLSDGSSIDTWYYSPKNFYRFFAEKLTWESCFPVGFSIPPSYLNPFFHHRPKTLQRLKRLEEKCQNLSFAPRCADHFFIHLSK